MMATVKDWELMPFGLTGRCHCLVKSQKVFLRPRVSVYEGPQTGQPQSLVSNDRFHQETTLTKDCGNYCLLNWFQHSTLRIPCPSNDFKLVWNFLPIRWFTDKFQVCNDFIHILPTPQFSYSENRLDSYLSFDLLWWWSNKYHVLLAQHLCHTVSHSEIVYGHP